MERAMHHFDNLWSILYAVTSHDINTHRQSCHITVEIHKYPIMFIFIWCGRLLWTMIYKTTMHLSPYWSSTDMTALYHSQNNLHLCNLHTIDWQITRQCTSSRCHKHNQTTDDQITTSRSVLYVTSISQIYKITNTNTLRVQLLQMTKIWQPLLIK